MIAQLFCNGRRPLSWRTTIPTILIASFLEPVHVQRIAEAFPDLRIHCRPELLRQPRYAADHDGAPSVRTPAQEAEWRALLADAEIMFDFDQTHREDLPELAPRVRWIQATSSGIGPFVEQMRYRERMPATVFTRASGVHAQPLGEFCLMAMMMHARGYAQMAGQQSERRWQRFAGTDLRDRTVVIVGLGAIGSEVARMAHAIGMRVVGVGRTADPPRELVVPLDAYHSVSVLDAVLPEAEYLVLVVPHTPDTVDLMGPRQLALLPAGAVVINIGRGALVDEAALIEALQAGHLGGAALDVFREEPLAPESPLWTLPNVLISPHSASTSDRENARLTDLFIENLGRYLAGTPLKNVLR